MPLSMKIQPIEVSGTESEPIPAKPVVKSRLKRLFRISVPEKDEPPPSTVAVTAVTAAMDVFEPSSVCLAKMVQNFIEENNNNEKHASTRNRCNCFNGNGSDGSDGEGGDNVTAADVCDFLKSLVVCATVNERNVLADTARVVAEKNKACKRKDELRKLVVEGLIAVGYDSAICKSKWEKSPSFPAGEYEYVDVIVGGERLIIDIDFRSEFEVARSTKTYKSILQTLPNIFVGKSDRLSKIICIISEAAKQSLKKKGMHIPPWRKADYVQAKWLSPPTRVLTNPVTPTPPPTPITPIGSLTIPTGPSPNKTAVDLATILAGTHPFDNPEAIIHICQTPNKPTNPNPNPIPLATILAETHHQVDGGSEVSSASPQSETIFEMSESSGEEDVKVEAIKEQTSPKKSLKIITGLTTLMEHNP